MKRKRISSISMAPIEDIGELEGKKSLFEDILAIFEAKEIWPQLFKSWIVLSTG